MKTQTTARYAGRYAVNVALGYGDFVVEKARELAGNMRSFDPREFAVARQQQIVRLYDEFAERGEKLRKSVRNSAPAKRAVEQSKAAKSQVKAARTSVRKAVQANAEATRSAAKKVG